MTLSTPFVCIEGNWFVAVEWRPDEPLPTTMTLRALDKQEVEWLEPRLVDASADAWARMFQNDDAIRNGAEPSDED